MKQLITSCAKNIVISQKIGRDIDLDPNQIGTQEDLRIITPEDVEKNLVDNFEYDESITNNTEVPDKVIDNIQNYEDDEQMQKNEEIPEFNNVFDAIGWAENNGQSMRIHYVTLRGNNLIRDIEPHGHYYSTDTNRSVVVAWDDTIGDVRSFVIMNILEFELLGKKFTPKFFFSSKKNRVNKLRKIRHK